MTSNLRFDSGRYAHQLGPKKGTAPFLMLSSAVQRWCWLELELQNYGCEMSVMGRLSQACYMRCQLQQTLQHSFHTVGRRRCPPWQWIEGRPAHLAPWSCWTRWRSCSENLSISCLVRCVAGAEKSSVRDASEAIYVLVITPLIMLSKPVLPKACHHASLEHNS